MSIYWVFYNRCKHELKDLNQGLWPNKQKKADLWRDDLIMIQYKVSISVWDDLTDVYTHSCGHVTKLWDAYGIMNVLLTISQTILPVYILIQN